MSSGGALQPLHAAEPLLTQRLPPALAEPERKSRESARLASHLAAVRPPRCPAALSQPADRQPGAIQQRHAHSQASVMWIGAEHARLHQGCVKGLARSIASKQHAFLGSPPVSPPATTRARCLGTGRQPRGRLPAAAPSDPAAGGSCGVFWDSTAASCCSSVPAGVPARAPSAANAQIPKRSDSS